MKLFVRGGVGLVVAAFFASFLIFQAQPLSAINSSQQSAQEEQPKKKEPAGIIQQKQTENVQSETGEVSETSSGTPSSVAVKDSDLAAATTLKVNNTEKRVAGLTAPQPYIAFSYSWCCKGASGLGTRRGTIAADPRVLPFGTRVYIEGAGAYNGEYLVTDSGTAIKGNKIDVWVPTLKEARRFGRKNVKLTVLSYGARRGTKRAR